MEQYIIKGGNPLVGEVEIGGAKNAALAILATAIMTDETVTIENLPNVRDINVMLDAIAGIGGKVERVDLHTVKIMNILRKSGLLIIFWGLCLENIKKRRLRFPEAATLEAGRSICI